MLSGLVNPSTVSVEVQPMATTSTIALAAVRQLGLLAKFDHFGRYICNPLLSVLTSGGFYTSRTSLRCSHASGDSDIILGSDWISVTNSVFCSDGSGLLDPSQSAIASLPEGYHWSPNEGMAASYPGVVV